ncbi:glycoside hydrolase family 76 protein [Xylariaceae sp. FL0594]|nr:glycoside hydrolase family 76 protein [Xylariaceae sp. FL0594]
MKTTPYGLTMAVALAHGAGALDLNINDAQSIKSAASTVAKGLYVFHNEAATTGQFDQPKPWFWWLSGSGWNGLMDYTVYTQDTTYKKDLLSALSKNVGPNFDFVPPEQAGWEANDDQAYWLFNALTAMEYNFDTLPGAPSWETISTNAFNLFVKRWQDDSETCSGGLKWQYNPKANGWTYKNAVTNGAFFQTAARLARYTGDQKFADWAVKIWDWSRGVGLVSQDYHVYDGTGDDKGANCSQVNRDEWSYNIASFIHGAAHLYNFTADPTWENHVHGLVDTAAATFFNPAKTGIMVEQKCEANHACSTDQTSFKASLARWLGKTAVLVPSLKQTIVPLLEKSAQGAAKSCSGLGNSTCGQSWTTGSFDGQSDFGVELSALETIQSLLVFEAPAFASKKGASKDANPPPTQQQQTQPTQTATATPTEKPTQATMEQPTQVVKTVTSETAQATPQPVQQAPPTKVGCGKRRRAMARKI